MSTLIQPTMKPLIYSSFPAPTPLNITQPSPVLAPTGLSVRLATLASEIEQAQRLRHLAFLEEFGVDCGANGIDADEFDPFCDHLLVEDSATGMIVGTYRLLNSQGALRCGKRYGQGEFTGNLWQDMGNNMLELGRACIHPSYRTGAALMKLWQGIMDYLGHQGVRYAIGYASVGLRDGGLDALATQRYLAQSNKIWQGEFLNPINLYTTPLALQSNQTTLGEPPALIKGYLRMGAFSIGEPAYDSQFNTADFPLLLDMTQLEKRYAKHFKVSKTLSTLN